MFACAHPAIEASIRAPLILQVVLGLDAAMIASVFLMSPAAMGQRLVRAKNKIRQAGIPFRSRSGTTSAGVSTPSSMQFTPPSLKVGSTLREPMSRAGTWRRKLSSWVGW